MEGIAGPWIDRRTGKTVSDGTDSGAQSGIKSTLNHSKK